MSDVDRNLTVVRLSSNATTFSPPSRCSIALEGRNLDNGVAKVEGHWKLNGASEWDAVPTNDFDVVARGGHGGTNSITGAALKNKECRRDNKC